MFLSTTGISYGGATEHAVVCSTELFKPKKIRNLEIAARGDASLDIDTWDSPSDRASDLDPSARANAQELNPGQHFDPAGETSVDTDNYQWVFSSIANLDIGSTTNYVVIESTTTDNTPNCDSCTDGCSSCPITYACGNHSGPSSDSSGHEWGTAPCGDDTHVGYLC